MADLATAETPDVILHQVIEAAPGGERIRSCLQCGACSGVCPYGFAMAYPPHALIAELRAREFERVLERDTIWLCVSCFACTESCPAKIPLTNGLLTFVKTQMLLKGGVPSELQLALENSHRYGNTLGESPRKRADWAKDLTIPVPVMAKHKEPVDVLWYVGDYASYHPRAQQVTRALAKVLQALGVRFGILGPEESSDGDAQCLAGERGLFELLSQKNMSAMSKYSFKEVLTSDPHAYNVFRNEYPRMGFSFPVRHYTQFLADHVDQLRLRMRLGEPTRVAYHDPCCLGRANQNNVYEEPRLVLEAIPAVELVEMSHARENSICCGGGGGGMWLDGFVWEHTETRISEWRIAEAVASGAQVLAVACPYEPMRFEDAAKAHQGAGQVVVKDIAELLAEALVE